MEKTYTGWREAAKKSKQTEYTEPTKLLASNGTLLAKGYAKHNVFDYDRNNVKKKNRRKEWDFYQISDGQRMLQVSFANISLGGYASVVLVDLKEGKTLISDMTPFIGGKDRYILPSRGDVPNYVSFRIGKAVFEVNTGAARRSIRCEHVDLSCSLNMDIPGGR